MAFVLDSQDNASYSTDDVTSVTVDGLVIFGITVIGLAGLIALIFLFKWARKNMK